MQDLTGGHSESKDREITSLSVGQGVEDLSCLLVDLSSTEVLGRSYPPRSHVDHFPYKLALHSAKATKPPNNSTSTTAIQNII